MPATATTDGQTQTSSPPMIETATTGDAPLVTLTRSGGITGQTVTVVVQRDGMVQIGDGEAGGAVAKEGRATPEQMEKLEAALQTEGWQQLDASYGRQVPDGFAYTVVAGSKTVQTYDGAENPSALANVLSLLDELEQQVLQG